jgi:predicted SprT family Zn-dependent metalloprotease
MVELNRKEKNSRIFQGTGCHRDGILLASPRMGRLLSQLEFRWVSWLRVRASPLPAQAGTEPLDRSLTAWCVETAKALNLIELSNRVRVSWNARMQTTAGRAWWPDRMIELNPKLKNLPPEELWRTLKHELAHLVAYERAGRRHTEPHGPEWRAACAELGIPNEQPFHTLPFKRRRMKRNHVYTCPNCLIELRRVKPLGRAVACYNCCRKHNGGVYDSRFRLVAKVP